MKLSPQVEAEQSRLCDDAARDMELAPTRRMPSDAVAKLWLDELEGL